MPQIMPAFADIIAEDSDLPGGLRVADRIRKMTGMGDPQEQLDPNQLQQELQKAGQIVQMLSQELDAKNKILEQEQLKIEADLRKASMDNATKLEIERLRAQSDVTIESMKQQMADMQQQQALLAQMLTNTFAAAEQGREHAHAQTMAEHQAAQEQIRLAHEAEQAQQQPQQGGAQ
jgi:hypothetical protein